MDRLSVTHYGRRPRKHGNFSLEAIFADVRKRLEDEVDIRVRIAPELSDGILPRLRILFDVWRHRREALHFTGDIHFAAISARKGKAILTIHDCSGLVDQHGLRAFLLKWLWFKIPVGRVAKVTAVSEASKRDIVALTNCSPEKVVVIRNAISDRFQRCDKPFEASSPRILQVGTAFNKNIERLVQALIGLPCRLTIIGALSGSQKQAVVQSGVCVENLVNLSEEEMLSQYRQCDIVSLVSTFEGFGLPIVEAQCVGRAVVTSNCSSMPEVAGTAACLVDPFDIDSIRRGFRQVIEDAEYRESLISAGFENARRFNPDSVARQYFDMYKSVFGTARSEYRSSDNS